MMNKKLPWAPKIQKPGWNSKPQRLQVHKEPDLTMWTLDSCYPPVLTSLVSVHTGYFLGWSSTILHRVQIQMMLKLKKLKSLSIFIINRLTIEHRWAASMPTYRKFLFCEQMAATQKSFLYIIKQTGNEPFHSCLNRMQRNFGTSW